MSKIRAVKELADMALNTIGSLFAKLEFLGKTTLTDIGLEEYQRKHELPCTGVQSKANAKGGSRESV